MYQLQTANPYEFYLTEFFPTSKNRELESLLHKKYKLKRYKREWFKLTDEEVLEACYLARDFIGKPYLKISSNDIENHQHEVERNNRERVSDNDVPF